jgi:hypothetical protein
MAELAARWDRRLDAVKRLAEAAYANREDNNDRTQDRNT